MNLLYVLLAAWIIAFIIHLISTIKAPNGYKDNIGSHLGKPEEEKTEEIHYTWKPVEYPYDYIDPDDYFV